MKFKGNQKRKWPNNGVCFNYEELGHFSSRCNKRKGESSGQGKGTKEHNRLENPRVRGRGGRFPLSLGTGREALHCPCQFRLLLFASTETWATQRKV